MLFRRFQRLVAFGVTLGALSSVSALAFGQEKDAGDEKSEQDDGDEGDGDEGDDDEREAEVMAKTAKKAKDRSPFSGVRASDWFTLSSPAFELDGYFRVRSELFHNFSLSRKDGLYFDPLTSQTQPLWPRPIDDSFAATNGVAHGVELCGSDPTKLEACKNSVQAGANMRLRVEPSLSISDNVRIQSQIDMLDNIVLGSTPQGYGNLPAQGGYQTIARGGYAPLGSFASTQWAPQAGVTSTKDAILVKRVWGEYMSPFGKLAFGRMPFHWGLGMRFNSGDTYDSDWQSTVDRLAFTYSFPSWNLHLRATWDFANEGVTGLPQHTQQTVECDDPSTPDVTEECNGAIAGNYSTDGQPYDLATKDDLDQWTFTVLHQVDPQLTRYRLAKGSPVINGGGLFIYNKQTLAQESFDPAQDASLSQPVSNVSKGLVRRGYEAVTGDLWLQLLYHKLRFEVEAALIFGSLENTLQDDDSNFDNPLDPSRDGWRIQQFGIATETEWRTLEDRLRLGFKFGYATGDADVPGLSPLYSAQSGSGLERQLTLNRTLSRFDFHPDYRIDLILFRNILTRVTGTYYFRPSVEYDFYRNPDGQRIGASSAVIWSRASQTVQAPGHAPDLGVEVNLRLYYQLSPGRLHYDIEKMGGFFTAIDYGLLLPLQGLGYLPGEVDAYKASTGEDLGIAPAQIARWYLGVMF
ncbi:MAG: TIGR04551 family protein [Polyangiaceae bacterium]